MESVPSNLPKVLFVAGGCPSLSEAMRDLAGIMPIKNKSKMTNHLTLIWSPTNQSFSHFKCF